MQTTTLAIMALSFSFGVAILTRAAVKTIFALLAGFIAVASTAPSACAQVAACARKMSVIGDGRLQTAIDRLRAQFPHLNFRAERACDQAKLTVNALASSLRRDYLKSLAGFEYVTVVDGDGYFTIERFRLPKPAARHRFVAALDECPNCKLQIPENTCLAHFADDDSVVLMISAAAACKASREKFEVVERAFRSAEAKVDRKQ